ncbi:glycosyltransferase [Microbacterium sp.]|uniref:glycosyltransferase family protein n=1 Tax=Microbacterium sp. TaxID=51671 RepID=UPI0039E520E0
MIGRGGTVGRALAATRQRRRLRAGRLSWVIKISAPADESAARWGDTAFAEDLAVALRALGQHVRIDFLGSAPGTPGDVVLVLRGLHRIDAAPGALNYLWIISHPDAVTDEELSGGWDRVFAASRTWPRGAAAGAIPLLQAASTTRFSPGPGDPAAAEDVLFVGTSRGVVRPVVRDAIAAGAPLAIYGHDWEDYVEPRFVRADHLAFARVPTAYRSARIVLNDHWEDMRRNGFISNRLFDATFVGARVISDSFEGREELFGGLVRTYADVSELRSLLTDEGCWPSEAERHRLAAAIRQQHSFDARAATLLDYALRDTGAARPTR